MRVNKIFGEAGLWDEMDDVEFAYHLVKNKNICNFGVITVPLTAALISAGLGSVTAGIVAPALTGALVGTLGSAVTGGDVGQGALFGGITGGFGGLGGALGAEIGSPFLGDVLAGAGGGFIGGAATGQDLGTSALTGGISGALKGLSADGTELGTTGGTAAGTGAGAGGPIAPAGVGGAGPDLTNIDFSNSGDFGTSTGSSSVSKFLNGGSGAADALSAAGPRAGSVIPDIGQGAASAVSSAAPAAATAAPAASAAAAGAGSSFSQFLKDPSFSNFGNVAEKNASWLFPAAGLVKDAVTANQPTPGENELTAMAQQFGAQGSKLSGYLESGTLPPGVQGGINQAAEAAKATIRSRYASMGMSGSSSESTDLANVERSAQTQGANIAMNLLQQGANQMQLSAGLYENIMKNAMARDKSFSDALARMGAAAGGGAPGGQTLKLSVA